jgi:hypothetical protein
VNEAKLHRNQAVAKGVADAFVVAYYQGKRISIAEANKLLVTNGSDILKKQAQNSAKNMVSNQTNSNLFIDSTIKLPEVGNRIKPNSFIQYSIDCKPDEVISKLERLNRIGIFTYQFEQGKILSEKMKKDEVSNIHKEYLKDFQLENQQIDSSYLVQLDVSSKLSNGSFTDWLLRSDFNYRIDNDKDITILNLYLTNEVQRNLVLRKAEELMIKIINN